ncbi:MAG: cache domain-containing protein [Nitrosospira sp.]
MKLRQKIILFAVMPLMLALCAIALTVRYHAISLAQQEREVITPAYLATKDAELKNYVAIAKRAIAHLYESGKTDEATKAEAKKILEKLEYGEDGYFFLYDLNGNLLMHPKLKDWVGRNMWNIPDAKGNLVVRELTLLARKGGGFYDYVWPKYSTGAGDHIPKRAYAIDLPAWGWMLGSGVYLDDVDNALSEIDMQVSKNIDDTMIWIAGIAFFSAVAIFLGLMLSIRERTALDDKLSLANKELTALAQRVINARDEERIRIEKDLHDGVKPMLVAVKMKIETGLIQLPNFSEHLSSAKTTFKSAADLLKESLHELTNIILDIRPGGSHSLSQRLEKLSFDMTPPGTSIEFASEGETHGLTSDAGQILFLIAKTALDNMVAHSAAHRASVRLEGRAHFVKLEICDDGMGFDVNNVTSSSGCGIGLRNMKERLESVGGQFKITSSPSGTCVTATLPLS